jgi:hypothetical protein
MIDCQDLLALTLAQPIAITRKTASGVLPAAEDDCDRLASVLFGIPRMNPELAWMVAIFWIDRKPRCGVSMVSASRTVRTALEGLIWRFFLT